MDLFAPALNQLLDLWLDEDIGRGDLTSAAFQDKRASAHWITKEAGIFCGGPVVKKLFKRLDQSIKVQLLIPEGEKLEKDQKILEIEGPVTALLAGERASLNLAMRLSGIATYTAKLVSRLEGTGVRLADTRKTTPGLRLLEKYAVRCGGGVNHRLGLDDAAMLKENHLAWAGSIDAALLSIRSSAPWPSQVIVEAENSKQAEDAVLAGADGVLLDELSPNTLKTLVPRLRKMASNNSPNRRSNQVVLEASGIDPMELKSYANTGVDLISTSAPITRSKWLDFSMRFD